MKPAFRFCAVFVALIIAAAGAFADADHPDSKGICWADNEHGSGRHVVICNIPGNLTVSVGKDGTLKCMGDRTPCTQDQVKQLSATPGIKKVVLAPDGTLECETADGKKCTGAQLPVLNKAVAAAAQTAVTKSLSNIKGNLVISQRPDGMLTCKSADAEHTPCGKDQVAQLNALNLSKSGIKTVSLATADGTLTCVTTDGKKCTGAQVTELTNAATAMNAASGPALSPGK